MAVDTNHSYALATDDEDFPADIYDDFDDWWEGDEEEQDLIDDTDEGAL